MELFSPGHLIPLLIVVAILFFGWKQLPDMARSVGRSLRIFKTEMKGMSEDDAARQGHEAVPPAVAPIAAPTTTMTPPTTPPTTSVPPAAVSSTPAPPPAQAAAPAQVRPDLAADPASNPSVENHKPAAG